MDSLGTRLSLDLQAFFPEVILCLGIVVMLVMRLFETKKKSTHAGYFALGVVVLALAVSVLQWLGDRGIGMLSPTIFPAEEQFHGSPRNAFTGLLVYDFYTIYIRLFLFSFTILIIWLTLITGIPDREDSADFHVLLLGSVLGMSLMASTNHLLMMFIGIEMASLPSYALAGFLKGRRRSSEAALKYVVYGGGAAGVMLYGISLLAGKFGTAYLPQVCMAFATAITSPEGGLVFDPILILGALFVLIGIAFKLAAVPFHFWCPDVFEGASAEVAGFLSVASKGAALALLARITMYFSGTASAQPLIIAISVFAIVTATFGNLAAFWQSNLKRLLAYSTIAQAGYMMMGVGLLNVEGNEAVLFYLIAYLFTNLGAFAIIAFLRNQIGTEDLSGYRGLVTRSPLMVVSLSICLLSLLGVPPLIGFAAKFHVFAAMFDAAQQHASLGQKMLSSTIYLTLVMALINSVTSAVYYLKVMKVMIIEQTVEDVEGTEPQPIRTPFAANLFAGLMAATILVAGLAWGPLNRLSEKGVRHWTDLHKKPEPPQSFDDGERPIPGAGGGGGGGGQGGGFGGGRPQRPQGGGRPQRPQGNRGRGGRPPRDDGNNPGDNRP